VLGNLKKYTILSLGLPVILTIYFFRTVNKFKIQNHYTSWWNW